MGERHTSALRVAARHLEAAYPKEFLEAVKGQRYRNTNPRGRKDTLLFRSLPSDEQQKIYQRWQQGSSSQESGSSLRSVEESGVKFETGKPVEVCV